VQCSLAQRHFLLTPVMLDVAWISPTPFLLLALFSSSQPLFCFRRRVLLADRDAFLFFMDFFLFFMDYLFFSVS
jgi:hypothetical protein